MKIALAGNPNSGKTTLFNALTGSNQFVGNWPGVTVEKKEGKLKEDKEVIVVDLPGVYSLSPYTLEEVVARNVLLTDTIDAIVNIVDGTNLERNLYLTTQLLELGIPVVIAINMMDMVRKKGDIIDISVLSKELGCPVIEISALKAEGLTDLIAVVMKTSQGNVLEPKHTFSKEMEEVLLGIENQLSMNIKKELKRFYAIKLFERDSEIAQKIMPLTSIEELIISSEKRFDDDAEGIITNERYLYISSIIDDCYKKQSTEELTTSDKIDHIVTNRWLAIPIFILVMWLVYYLSVSSIGSWLTTWANDGVFGEGWSLFGLDIPGIPVIVSNGLQTLGTADWLNRLILDGIIGGVGAVLGFVPQIFVVFLLLGFLEACGYMSRIAFILDRVFRKFGLSGKSFIPMLVGTGCGVPGIMASRTIENEQDRKMTIITTTFIPCSAKLPIIAMIAGAMFNGASWVAPSAYFVGILAVICSGIILKKTRLFIGDPAPFVMELPAYHMPTLSNVLRSMWERGWDFIKKAGTIILLSSICIWFASSFGFENGKFGLVTNLENGLLSNFGKSIAWIFSPLGWGDLELAVAAITGLLAKENVVGTLGVLFGEQANNGTEIWKSIATNFTTISAYSFLLFNLLCAPCIAAMSTIKREMNSGKWTFFAIAYQTLLAYIVALCVYQIGTWIQVGTFGFFTMIALLLIVSFMYLLVRPTPTLKKRG
jgi:ferrous iron transport protein B